MNIHFKYFDRPDLFTGFIETEASCDICGNVTKCFDAGLFVGEEEISAICPDCLQTGELHNREIYTCEGDIDELRRQLKVSFPNSTDEEIDSIARERTTELEKTTPALISWQDWNWPCADGEYCKFIGYGSKALYGSLAKAQDPKELFNNSFYYNVRDLSDVDRLWADALPEEEIKSFEESNRYSILFYVFKSLNSDKIVTIWDCD